VNIDYVGEEKERQMRARATSAQKLEIMRIRRALVEITGTMK
jgi:hypothetical protein